MPKLETLRRFQIALDALITEMENEKEHLSPLKERRRRNVKQERLAFIKESDITGKIRKPTKLMKVL
jgi:hypothetical protein